MFGLQTNLPCPASAGLQTAGRGRKFVSKKAARRRTHRIPLRGSGYFCRPILGAPAPRFIRYCKARLIRHGLPSLTAGGFASARGGMAPPREARTQVKGKSPAEICPSLASPKRAGVWGGAMRVGGARASPIKGKKPGRFGQIESGSQPSPVLSTSAFPAVISESMRRNSSSNSIGMRS